jgi:hypothetical protein
LNSLKKIISYVLLFALLLSILPPLQPVQAATPSFFVPDDAILAGTANMNLIPPSGAIANLNRTTAKISNSSTMSITGIFQQVTGSSITLTVDQITSINGALWKVESGRTFTTAVGTTSNRFTVNGVELFPGYNRLTLTGAQGGSTMTDVFYVLYDSAPLINRLQITSNNTNFDLNESANLVLNTPVAYIQGTADNATNVSVNGLNASVLSNGLFYAPSITLKAGLNVFDITLSNATDSVTVKRQVYYYDSTKPITVADINGYDAAATPAISETKSLLSTPIPTLTNVGAQASLDLEFLVPYRSAAILGNTSINITNSVVTPNIPIIGTPTETVITNTYGAPAYKIVRLKTDMFPLNTTSGVINDVQSISVSITYPTADPAPLTINGNYTFNHVNGTIVNDVTLLPNYNGVTAITDATPSVPFDGSQVTGPEFYVLVTSSKVITENPNDQLVVAIQPTGTIALGVAAVPGPAISGAYTDKKLYKISGLPEGSQTLAFSVDTAAIGYTGKITYVSKLYIDLENLYDDQIFTYNSDSAAVQPVHLKGKIIGFGSNLLGKQMIINNIDQTNTLNTAIVPPAAPVGTDYDYDITDTVLNIGGVAPAQVGPLFTGRNTLKIILTYKDAGGGILRTYVKEVTFYIVDSNVPSVNNVRPLTPPKNATSIRGLLSSANAADYLVSSPEFVLSNRIYSTSLSKFDMYISGSGADNISVKEGGAEIYNVGMSAFVSNPTPTAFYDSVEVFGSRTDFRIRLNNVLMTSGTHVYTIDLTNSSGARVSYTLTVTSQNVPYRILSPLVNTGDKIIVNKNFVNFDIEAVAATSVTVNGKAATPRTDVANRYTYTLTGLKADSDNKITLVVKNTTATATETVVVNYVMNPAPGAMFMEALGTKHAAFNKDVQLTFPKGNALRRVKDGKLQPVVNVLFGIADPLNGNTELVNDYNQVLGTDIDFRTPQTSQTVIPIDSSLSTQFSNELGRDHFTRVSEYYWISAGLGEKGKVGDAGYKTVTGGLAPYSTEGTYTRYADFVDRELMPTERGTLTLKYDSSVVDQSAPEVTVFFLGSNGVWKNIGGEVNPKSNTVEVPFDNFGYYMVGKLKYGYDDVSNHPWARNVLQALLAKGYMPALRSNEFGVSDYVTRGEFAGMLVRSLGLRSNSQGNNTFLDIVTNSVSVAWNYDEIETAARAGIVQGLNSQIFAPDSQLTRQDAAVMISRALNSKLAVNDDKLKAKLDKAFADSDTVNVYARPAVESLSSSGIIVGTNVVSPLPTTAKPLVNFNPLANMTRAEAGQISVRILQKFSKVLPANL